MTNTITKQFIKDNFDKFFDYFDTNDSHPEMFYIPFYDEFITDEMTDFNKEQWIKMWKEDEYDIDGKSFDDIIEEDEGMKEDIASTYITCSDWTEMKEKAVDSIFNHIQEMWNEEGMTDAFNTINIQTNNKVTKKQITESIIQVGDKFYEESDEENYYYPMEDVVFDEFGIPQSYSVDISVHISEIINDEEEVTVVFDIGCGQDGGFSFEDTCNTYEEAKSKVMKWIEEGNIDEEDNTIEIIMVFEPHHEYGDTVFTYDIKSGEITETI